MMNNNFSSLCLAVSGDYFMHAVFVLIYFLELDVTLHSHHRTDAV